MSRQIFKFLTEYPFPERHNILITHDVVIVTLLKGLNVYPFTLEDWCGFVQGAALFQEPESGVWTLAYAVPDAEKREKACLFI